MHGELVLSSIYDILCYTFNYVFISYFPGDSHQITSRLISSLKTLHSYTLVLQVVSNYRMLFIYL